MNTVIGGIGVEYEERGSGPPVVLVHGLAEDHHSFDAQLEALGRRHRVLAYDLRGHGGTELGQADGSLDQLAGDLVALLRASTGPAACVGFSLGGTVVLRAASLVPELVTHAVVLGTSSVVGRAAAEFYAGRIALVATGDQAALADAMREDTRAALADPEPVLDQLIAYRLRAIGDGRGYANAAAAMARLREEPLTPALASLMCHVDVVGAELDSFCPRKAAEILLGALPDAAYHEIAGAGHLMNVERPAAVTQLLDGLLKKEGAR